MSTATSDRSTSGTAPGSRRRRLPGEDRRTALVDAAAFLVAQDGVDAVSMETVAAQAGVSRPLVYKHFANRHELLAAVLRREAVALDAAIAAHVEQANGLEAKVRALIRALLKAASTRGPVLTPLLQVGAARDPGFRQEQLARDRRTVRFFARLAAEELHLGKAEATAAMAVLLTGIDSVRAQVRADPSPEHRTFLEELYVDLVMGGLTAVSSRRRPSSTDRSDDAS